MGPALPHALPLCSPWGLDLPVCVQLPSPDTHGQETLPPFSNRGLLLFKYLSKQL